MPIAEVDLKREGSHEDPVNREPPVAELVSGFLTCTKEKTYDRNHGSIQHHDAETHAVTVDGLVRQELKLTVRALEKTFPQHKVTCALQCAGNRRHSMRTRIKEVSGVDWFDAAVMNCVFEGPRVRDILLAAGIKDKETFHDNVRREHVQFANYGGKVQEDEWYGGSIPFARAMDPQMDVILAVKMNGQPLSPRHGAPVRAIVPGVLGARSVKWLDRITVSDEESTNFYQQHDYKILPPEVKDMKQADSFWGSTPAMLEMPINACVGIPETGSTVSLPASGLVEVIGYAVPQGHSGPVVRVQVSADDGKTWIDAQLDNGGKLASKWSWVLWNAKVSMGKGQGQCIFAKATDAGGNTQDQQRSTWNLRGVGYNGYEANVDLTVV